MSFSASIPPLECLVRSEALYDGEANGETNYGHMHMVVSIPDSCLHFNVVLDNGAMWDEVPIQMLCLPDPTSGLHQLHQPATKELIEGLSLDPGRPPELSVLQRYNCPSTAMAVEYRDLLVGRCVEYLDPQGLWIPCNYLMTLNWSADRHGTNLGRMQRTGPDPMQLLVRLDGYLAAQPNSRCRVVDATLCTRPWPEKRPDYRARTAYSWEDSCEHGAAPLHRGDGDAEESAVRPVSVAEGVFIGEVRAFLQDWMDRNLEGEGNIEEFIGKVRSLTPFDSASTGPLVYGDKWLEAGAVPAAERERHRRRLAALNNGVAHLRRRHGVHWQIGEGFDVE